MLRPVLLSPGSAREGGRVTPPAFNLRLLTEHHVLLPLLLVIALAVAALWSRTQALPPTAWRWGFRCSGTLCDQGIRQRDCPASRGGIREGNRMKAQMLDDPIPTQRTGKR
jgi:hypothetical protein